VSSKREEFFRLADAVVEDGESDPWTAEPWPSWFQKVVLRLTRVFLPSLKVADFKLNRERFEGYGLALLARLAQEASKVDTTKLPNEASFEALKAEVNAIATGVSEGVQKALQAATMLPMEGAAEVLAAYADGIKKDTFTFAKDRLGDSQTAQVCLFLIFARPWIETRRIASVTALFDTFVRIKEAFPGQKEFLCQHPQVRRTLEAQFRNICSEDGIKIRGRGRPRKIQPAKS